MNRRRARAAAGAAAALAAVVLAACGANGPSPSAARVSSAGGASPASAAPVVAVPVATTPSAPPNPCATNDSAQLVKVSLKAQHLWMCAHHTLVRDTPITSGVVGQYTETPTGTYTVQALDRHSTLTLNTGRTYAVKYWIPFDGPLFGFHDASWQNFPYGSPKYRTDGSHGCVHMPLAAIAFLYRWAEVGAKVRIHA